MVWEDGLRVTLVIFSLRGGGAERVMSIMANYWAAKGWKTTILTYDDGSREPAYEIASSVVWKPLGIECRSDNFLQSVFMNIKRLVVLRRAIRESTPKVVVSFLHSVNVRSIIASRGLGVPVIVSERTSPAAHRTSVIWSLLRRWSYRSVACLVAQTSEAIEYFAPAVRRRSCVIPNPLLGVQFRHQVGGADASEKLVIGMGRLSWEKGFDRVVRAFARVARRHSQWSLVIWGEGEGRCELEELRDRLGLRGRVRFPGWTKEPFLEMQRAGLFVLPSRYEGFPNVLCEAMASGLAVVSFDCPSGPRDIVRDGVDGILVPCGDVVALAAAIDRLLGNESERERLGESAMEVVRRFDVKRVMGMWDSVVHEVVEGRGTISC